MFVKSLELENYRNYKERLKIKKQQMQNKKRQNNNFMARSKKMSKTMSIDTLQHSLLFNNKKKDNKFKKNGGKNDLLSFQQNRRCGNGRTIYFQSPC